METLSIRPNPNKRKNRSMSTSELISGIVVAAVNFALLMAFYRWGRRIGREAGYEEGYDAARGRRAAVLRDYRRLLEETPMEGRGE